MNNIYWNATPLALSAMSPLVTTIMTPEVVSAADSTKSSAKSSLRRMMHEERLLTLQLNIVDDELTLKTEQVRKTIARLEEEIQFLSFLSQWTKTQFIFRI